MDPNANPDKIGNSTYSTGAQQKAFETGHKRDGVFAMRKWNISKTKRSLKISKAKMNAKISFLTQARSQKFPLNIICGFSSYVGLWIFFLIWNRGLSLTNRVAEFFSFNDFFTCFFLSQVVKKKIFSGYFLKGFIVDFSSNMNLQIYFRIVGLWIFFLI